MLIIFSLLTPKNSTLISCLLILRFILVLTLHGFMTLFIFTFLLHGSIVSRFVSKLILLLIYLHSIPLILIKLFLALVKIFVFVDNHGSHFCLIKFISKDRALLFFTVFTKVILIIFLWTFRLFFLEIVFIKHMFMSLLILVLVWFWIHFFVFVKIWNFKLSIWLLFLLRFLFRVEVYL